MNREPSIAFNEEFYHILWSLAALEEEIETHLIESSLKSEPEDGVDMLIQFWKAHLQAYLLVSIGIECATSTMFVETVQYEGGVVITCALSANISTKQLEIVNFDLDGWIHSNPVM